MGREPLTGRNSTFFAPFSTGIRYRQSRGALTDGEGLATRKRNEAEGDHL
jgi:hypothetical protein